MILWGLTHLLWWMRRHRQLELLEKAPQTFLGVHVVESLPVARQVNVEPCTPDDWELIQLHAGLLESELLRQVRAHAGSVCVLLLLLLLRLTRWRSRCAW